ncbi:hypothetical protein ACQEU3_42945 [Spirillospora sp. CA-253888]
MFILECKPPVGVGDIVIGAPLENARPLLEAWGEVKRWDRCDGAVLAVQVHEATVLVRAGESNLIEAVEIGCDAAPKKTRVMYRGIDIFAKPAREVLDAFRALNVDIDEDDPAEPIAPELVIFFNRNGECFDLVAEDGFCQYFTSILVTNEQYY